MGLGSLTSGGEFYKDRMLPQVPLPLIVQLTWCVVLYFPVVACRQQAPFAVNFFATTQVGEGEMYMEFVPGGEPGVQVRT